MLAVAFASNSNTQSTRCSRAIGPATRAVLRHVADEKDGDAGLLGHTHEAGGASRTCATEPAAEPRARGRALHRVDHADLRPLALQRRADPPARSRPPSRSQAAPPSRSSAQVNRAADSSADTTGRGRAARIGRAPSEQGRLAEPGSPPTGRATPGRAAAEHAVELRNAGGKTLDSSASTSARRGKGRAAAAGARRSAGRLDERSEVAAGRAFAGSAAGGVAALGANVEVERCLGHTASLGGGPDGRGTSARRPQSCD